MILDIQYTIIDISNMVLVYIIIVGHTYVRHTAPDLLLMQVYDTYKFEKRKEEAENK